MFGFIKKHRLFFDIVFGVVFGLGSAIFFIDYFQGEFDDPKKEKAKLIGAIVFGLMFIGKLVDLLEVLKNKKVE